MPELAEFFKVQVESIRNYMERRKPPLRYRIRLCRSGNGIERIVDSFQLADFLKVIWPTPAELDPELSPRHHEIKRRLDRVKGRMSVARRNLRRRDLSLRPIQEGIQPWKKRRNGKTNPSPPGPSDIEAGIGQPEPQPAPGECQEVDPYQGEGQGRSVAPRGREEGKREE